LPVGVAQLWIVRPPEHMNLHRPVPSSHKVWFIISVILFIGAWFLPAGKGDGYMPAGVIWYVFISGQYICPVSQMLTGISLVTLVCAVIATVGGWFLQFPVCIIWNRFHRRPNTALEPTPTAPSDSTEP